MPEPTTSRDFRRCAEATAAVEFALVGPILIATVLAMIEFGLALFTLQAAQQACWQMTRQVAMGRIRIDEVTAKIRSQLPSWAQPGASIPAATLANGVYSVSVSLKLSDATPLRFGSALYGSNVVSVRASFQSESN